MSDVKYIGVVQFPGSNCERETMLAIKRSGMSPVECLWNAPKKVFDSCDGFVIVGGFSYEDRCRAGAIAALDPVMDYIEEADIQGKPILGICNGAQILVEKGLVPGFSRNTVKMALASNQRIKNGEVIGSGFYNEWVFIKSDKFNSNNAFTQLINQSDILKIPVANGEGRFVLSDELFEFLNQNKVAMLKYCDSKGDVINDFPINPNGSMFNLAAIGNIRGNIMAIMPHPERTSQCDCIFNSMKKYIADTLHMAKNFERSEAIQKGSSKEIQSGFPNTTVKIKPNQIELIIESIITDNTAMSAELALQKLGYPVSLKRQIHWIIEHDGTNKNLLNDIIQSEELFNPRKEYVVDLLTRNSDAFVKSILVQEKQDSTGKNKLHNLKNIHNIFGIKNISYGVLWNISMNLENTDFENIINSNLFFNQYAHDVYFL